MAAQCGLRVISVLMVMAILSSTLSQKSTYSARVSISGNTVGKEDGQNEYTMNFKMIPDKINYGKTEGVDLFYIPVDASCDVKGVNHIEEWYAAYVNIPARCNQMDIVNALQTDGADFIFIEGETEEEFKLNARAIQVPVFSLKKSTDRYFMDAVNKARTTTDNTKKDPKQAVTISPILRLFITFPHRMSKDKYADVALFYSPANIRSFEYISAFYKVYSTMKEYMSFEPYLVVYKLSTLTNSRKNKNCYGKTPYCAADPDGEGEFTGNDVVAESLRQKCIFKESKEKWFNYAIAYSKTCLNQFDLKCSKNCMTQAGVDQDKVESCIERSQLGESDNTILKADYTKVKELNELNYPTLTINGNSYLGHIDSNFMGRSICETLTPRPDPCKSFDLRQVLSTEQSQSFFYSILTYFYVIVIGLLLMALVCICIARNAARKEVNDEVKRSVANYFMMKEVETLQ